MSTSDWWSHTLGWGSIAALVCGTVLVAVEFAAPYAFLNDYPADIRARAPRPTTTQRRAGVVGGIVFVLTLLTSIGGVVLAYSSNTESGDGSGDRGTLPA